MMRLHLHCGAFALVDDDAAADILEPLWRRDADGYVIRRDSSGKVIRLHRLVMSAQAFQVVDHIDRDPLNNTRANLRLVTPAENAKNRGRRSGTSRFRGVAWVAKARKWQVTLNRRYLGSFSDEIEAAEAWVAAAAAVFGQINIEADCVRIYQARLQREIKSFHPWMEI